MAVGVWLIVWTTTQPAAPRSPAPPASAVQPPAPASLKDIVAAAVSEGTLVVAWSGLDDTWRPRFEAGFNREFGLHLSLSTTADSTQADALVGSARQAGDVWRASLLTPQPWTKLFGAPGEASIFQDGALDFAEQTIRPARSAAKQIDLSTWEGLLNPALKGRLGVSNEMDVWADLSTSWGDDRTTQFMRGLAAQQPIEGSPDDLLPKIEGGAVDALSAVDSIRLQAAKNRAAAVAAGDPDPVLLQSVVAAPIRTASHPNAALLFCGYLITDEGQQLWRDYAGQASIYVVNSPLRQALASRQWVLANQTFLMSDQATRMAKYASILGL